MSDRYLGRYRLLRQIGRGGMATVYHAVQEGPHGFNQEVAIKLVHPELLANHPHVMQMLVDEARIAARIKHINVVRILDLCQEEHGFFMVMDYVDGLSMRQVLDVARSLNRPAPLGPVLDVLIHACEGLHAAHRLSKTDGTPLHLVHRDVKPGNILVGSEGEVKVADFGIALFNDRVSEATMHGQLKGTPAYMSPEQALGSTVDHRADLFSIGMTLYTLATNKLAFTAESATAVAIKITQESMEPHAAELDQLAPGLGEVLRLACAKNPDDRFQTALELGMALRSVRSNIIDHTTLAEMLAGAGWRPWDRSQSSDLGLPKSSQPAPAGSLLELSDDKTTAEGPSPRVLIDEDDDGPTVADEEAPTTFDPDLLGPVGDGSDEATDPGLADLGPPPGREDLTGTVVGPPPGPTPGAPASPQDLQETPHQPRVEILMPGEAPPPGTHAGPGPVHRGPPPPRRRKKRRKKAPGPPPAYLRPPVRNPAEDTSHGPRVQPERDYRGRVVRKAAPDESSTRVGTAERLAVVVTGLLLLVAVLAIVKLGMDEDGANKPDPTAGVALEEGPAPPPRRPTPTPAPAPTVAEKPPAEEAAATPAPTPSPPEPTPAPVREAPPKPKPEPTPEPTPPPPVATGPGTLTVSAYPYANVFVDGKSLGRTPLKGYSLPAGPHELKLIVPSAADKELVETVTIESDKETKVIRRIEVPKPAEDSPE